jgi:alpha-tubulin suppressor-like RCC1 family protein
VTIGVQKIAAGAYHTCALKYGGVVWCWGYNAYGQLGTGDTQSRRDGVNNNFGVPSLGTGRRAIDITAAAYSTCALLDNQTVKCWGYNGVGTLGLGDTTSRGGSAGQMGDALPAVSLGVTSVKQIAGGGFHVCMTDGVGASIKCWGYNVFGQLGLGDTNSRGDNPGEMGNALPFVAGYAIFDWTLVTGLYHSCTHANSGFVGRFAMKCWGYNAYGQLGLGNADNQGDNPGELDYLLPAAVNMGTDPDGSGLPWSVVGMATGWYHTCALLSRGVIKCWGYNGFGALGQGDTVTRGTVPADMGDGLPPINL